MSLLLVVVAVLAVVSGVSSQFTPLAYGTVYSQPGCAGAAVQTFSVTGSCVPLTYSGNPLVEETSARYSCSGNSVVLTTYSGPKCTGTPTVLNIPACLTVGPKIDGGVQTGSLQFSCTAPTEPTGNVLKLNAYSDLTCSSTLTGNYVVANSQCLYGLL
eukprot:comp12289_c0_seq1/m.15983 comp12289_c0_seq1/g.15983  ORF comp12289_c0_seq1/g.15983 comp12289_c0_seq1/m.15983 type:complete len:158 (-) comp12289_c0_seq1:458-931(-)